jgi:putative GTP pyrophosphokinase
MESRVKSWQSLEEKLIRKNLILKDIKDLDDLVGIRIILLFKRDVDAIQPLIQKSLRVLSSEDVASRLNETQFGYQSRHLVITMPETWLSIPSYSDLGGIRIEIQVRTLAQHIWATASHKLQYKHEASVPAPLRRSIHRASALLETIDIEFDRLLSERDKYLQEELPSAPPDQALNVETLRATLSDILPAQNRGQVEPYDDLLFDLNHFKIDSPEKLSKLLKPHMASILSSDQRHAKRTKKEYFFRHVGLVREGLRKEFGDTLVNKFLSSKNDKTAAMLQKRAKQRSAAKSSKSAT